MHHTSYHLIHNIATRSTTPVYNEIRWKNFSREIHQDPLSRFQYYINLIQYPPGRLVRVRMVRHYLRTQSFHVTSRLAAGSGLLSRVAERQCRVLFVGYNKY